MPMYIGENIRYLRNKSRLTQIEVAKRLHTTKQNIYKYEKGKITPPVNILLDLAEFFGVPLEDLIRYKLSNVMDDEINLDEDTIKTYSNPLDEIESKSGVAYSVENRIYFKNLVQKNAVLDVEGDFPHLEYLEGKTYYDKSSFSELIYKNYPKQFQSAIIHYTDSFLRIDEMDVIANAVGSEMDYKEHPSSLKVDINNDFLAYVKLISHCDKNHNLWINFQDTLLSLISSFWDQTLTTEGYQKVLNKLNSLLKKKFDASFEREKIDGRYDELYFYGFIKLFGIDENETLDELYERFNNKIHESLDSLVKLDLTDVIDKINEELFAETLTINIDFDKSSSRYIVNGFNSRIVESMKNDEAVAYYNYLIGKFLMTDRFEEIWDASLKAYLSELELNLSYEDISKIGRRLNTGKRVNDVDQYEQFLRTSWVTIDKGFLDSKTIRLIKYYLTQEIKKKM